MILFHFMFSKWHGPPLSYLHKKELRKYEEIDVGTNNEIMLVYIVEYYE